jgi:hypothetical protein
MTKHTCYSFEPSGHRFQPLDGFKFLEADRVLRLYCPRCGRVVETDPLHNGEGWDFESLPDASKVDAMMGQTIIRKSDA